MRFMILVKASKESEAGVMPTTEEFAAMGGFNQRMIDAGVMRAGEGLHPTSNAARIQFTGGQKSLVQGPFDEPGLVAGFWIIEVGSKQEAIDWMMQAPNPYPGDGNIEIRQIFAPEDFGDSFSDDLRRQEERMRVQTEG